jgi:hypothetical protein
MILSAMPLPNAEPEEADEDERHKLKALIAAAVDQHDGSSARRLIQQLERLNPTERCATSVLLDGYWETVYTHPEAAWMRASSGITHIIESWSPSTDRPGPGATGLLRGPTGQAWPDVRDGRGAYVQRARGRLGTREVRATYTWLGGDAWDLNYISRARLFLGVPVWRRQVAGFDVDLDHEIGPTFVDGDTAVLRSPSVRVGDSEVRAARVWVLRRLRHRLWQDDSFRGISDSGAIGIVDP